VLIAQAIFILACEHTQTDLGCIWSITLCMHQIPANYHQKPLLIQSKIST